MKFKDFLKEAAAQEYKPNKDSEDEVKNIEPRSKGEKDFANQHKVEITDRTPADEEGFNATVPDGKERKADNKSGETNFLKTYSQFMKMGGHGKSSKRPADSSVGDTAAMKVKEEFELEESFKAERIKLKDGSTVNIDKETAEALNNAMGGLSSSNKKKMQDELMKDKKSFNDMVKFAKDL